MSEKFQKRAVLSPQPDYPEVREGVWRYTGALIEVVVDETGSVVEATPLRCNSRGIAECLDAARHWKFPPYRVRGRPVRVRSAIRFERKCREFEYASSRTSEALTAELSGREDSAVANFNVGYVLLYHGSEYAAASVYLARATELRPDWALAHFELGHAYYASREFEKALAEYGMASEIDPDYFDPTFESIWCLDRLARKEGALNQAHIALAVAKTAADKIAACMNICSIAPRLGQYSEASDASYEEATWEWRYARVDDLAPYLPKEQAREAVALYRKANDIDGVIRACRLAVEIDPTSYEGLASSFDIADAYRELKKYDEMRETYDEILELTARVKPIIDRRHDREGLTGYHYWRGRAYEGLERFVEARDELKTAVSMRRDWADARLHLGLVLLELDRPIDAEKELRRSGLMDENEIVRLTSENR